MFIEISSLRAIKSIGCLKTVNNKHWKSVALKGSVRPVQSAHKSTLSEQNFDFMEKNKMTFVCCL